MPISERAAFDTQRTCNQCHVGCLDCHFDPRKKDIYTPGAGPHSVTKRPTSLSCYGGGRSFSCHAGPLERRRGDGYFRAEFTQASSEGKKMLSEAIDVHMKRQIACIDCHQPNKATGYHADLHRNVDCASCHAKTVAAHSKGVHKNVDCASCHVKLVGGYAFNFWTLGGGEGKKNPITRLQDYYVKPLTPILVKNPKGIWIPVHVIPHTSGNVVADEVKLSGRLLYRNKPDSSIERLYFSSDSYAITGLVRELDDKDHDTMVWFNVERVAHGIGKSRPCQGCHASSAQTVKVAFESAGEPYKDIENGEYTIIADHKGLRVVDFKARDGGPMPAGLGPFKDKWNLPGDFALPEIKNKKLFEKTKKAYNQKKFSH